MKTNRTLVSTFIAITLAACGRSTDTVSALNGITTTNILPKNSLSACWAGEPVSPVLGDMRPYERAIVEVIKRDFTIATTGVELTSFHDCDQGPSDIQIVWLHEAKYDLFGIASHVGAIDSRKYPKFAGPGVQDFLRRIDRPTIVLWSQAFADSSKHSKRSATALDAARYTALHEVGHIVGLFHEHDHDGSTCKAKSMSSSQRFEMFPDIGKDVLLDFGRAYDPYSIMSYCSGFEALGLEGIFEKDPSIDPRRLPAPSQIALTAADKDTLRRMYVAKSVSPQPQPPPFGKQPQQLQKPGSGLPGQCKVTKNSSLQFCVECRSLDGSTEANACIDPPAKLIDVRSDCRFDAQTLSCSDGQDGRFEVSI